MTFNGHLEAIVSRFGALLVVDGENLVARSGATEFIPVSDEEAQGIIEHPEVCLLAETEGSKIYASTRRLLVRIR